MAEVVPATVKRKRPEDDIGVQTGFFSHTHLRAMEAAQDGVENVPGGEIVEIMAHEQLDPAGFLPAQTGLLAIHFKTHPQIGSGRNRVHRDDPLDPHLFEDIDRQRVGNPAVDEQLVVHLHGSTSARNGTAGMDGGGYFAAEENGAFQRVQVGRHDAQRRDELRKVDIANRFFQTPFDLFAAKKALPRKNERIDQLEQAPAILDFAGQALHFNAIRAVSPDRTDVRAHAATGHHIDLDAVFLQDLNNTDVSEAARAARRERQANAPPGNLARQAANVGVEVFIAPGRDSRRGPVWTTVDKAVHHRSEGFEEFVALFLAPFATDDGMRLNGSAGARAQLPEEQITMIKILGRRIERTIKDIALEHSFGEHGWRDVDPNIKEHIIEVPAAMVNQGGDA